MHTNPAFSRTKSFSKMNNAKEQKRTEPTKHRQRPVIKLKVKTKNKKEKARNNCLRLLMISATI